MKLAALPALGVALVSSACLSVPEGPKPMCHQTSDCDTDGGEVCEEGTCWGNPPGGSFAAVVSPPATRHDLAPRELADLTLPPDGWMGDLMLQPPSMIGGKIVAFCPPPMTDCNTSTVPATVTITRPSDFKGGPGFKTAITVAAGADSFQMPVPRTKASSAPYTVTIVPDGRGDSPGGTGPTAAQLVPPLQITMTAADAATTKTFELGGMDLPVISGTLTNSLGQGLAMYRVVAVGRWDLAQAPVEVSTVDYTDSSGAYSITLSDELAGPIEIIARPSATTTLGATIHLSNIDSTHSATKSVVAPPSLGHEVVVTVPVEGVDNSGAVSPVRGARVSLQGVVMGSLANFTVSDDAVTDDNGNAALHVLDGNAYLASYRLSVIPPASSSLGVVYQQKLNFNDVQPVRLPARLSLGGKVRDADGHALAGVSVTARPSLRFLWTLDADPQAFVAAVPAATTVTQESGNFTLWVDPNIAETWAHYDLVFEPAAGARAPAFLQSEVEIPRQGNQTAVALGDIGLPDAAYVHGNIVDPIGGVLEDAELKLYRVTSDLSLCTQVGHAPPSCPIPAQLQGRATSDSVGTVRLTLPRQ